MKCISTRILVSVERDENKKNELGLVLPSALASQNIEKATVLYVGEEVKTELNKGDVIYIYKGSGTEFTSPEDNEKYRVINVTDIIVIL